MTDPMKDADERRDFAGFFQWTQGKVWMDNLGANEVVAGVGESGPGYLYPGDFYIKQNMTDRPDLGEYMTHCPFDFWGPLEACERALWEEYGADIAN